MTSTTTQPLTRRDIPVDRDLRILALGSFANRFGAGAVLTTSALYFTRQIGFGATEVALAMSVSAVVGIVVQVPAGHLGDTRGPRRVLTAFMVGAAVFSEPPVLATTPWMLALVFVLNAVLTGFAAWNSTRLPDIALHARAVGEPRLAVIRDWPYVVITVVTGLFSLHVFVMEPPHERQGQYQGFAGLGFSVLAVGAPPVVTYVCVDLGETGWLVLAVFMVVIAFVSVPAARWALASRGRYGVTTHSD